jgi:hypothetical protein
VFSAVRIFVLELAEAALPEIGGWKLSLRSEDLPSNSLLLSDMDRSSGASFTFLSAPRGEILCKSLEETLGLLWRVGLLLLFVLGVSFCGEFTDNLWDCIEDWMPLPLGCLLLERLCPFGLRTPVLS